MNYISKSLALIFLLTTLSSANAGVIVGGTRLIYNGGDKEASISVKNPDEKTSYLIQSWTDTSLSGEGLKSPFFITPPLFRLDAGEESILRVINTSNSLPADRESLYWLSVKSIAAVEKADINRMQIVVRTRIKLIYRPARLADQADDAFRSLKFSQKGNTLTVSNPTPYYISIYSLTVGGRKIEEPRMVAPFDSVTQSLPAGIAGKVTWQAINDFGGYTAVASQ